MRYFIRFSYLGTQYCGWQSQPQGQGLGIQQVLEQALSAILRTPIGLTGAGRTDAGVHARVMYAHFDVENVIEDIKKLIGRVNSFLPPDISVSNILRSRDDAHARFDATLREYQYFINPAKDPFSQQMSYFFRYGLDLNAMNRACDIMLEYSDFECFSKVHTDVKTFICRINYARWELIEENKIVFTISADRFLRNMVRAIVGTMLDIGRTKISPDDLRDIIESRSRCRSGVSVPACGLFLTRVDYPDDIFLE